MKNSPAIPKILDKHRLPYKQKKDDPDRIKLKNVAINRGNDQSKFHALVALHIVILKIMTTKCERLATIEFTCK